MDLQFNLTRKDSDRRELCWKEIGWDKNPRGIRK